MPQPIRLEPSFREKVWGAADLAPWYPSPKPGLKIGEVWFEHTPALPVLVKLLFTTEKLSVQVHPPGPVGTGKTEMWHILRAEPGASIAVGFREPVPAGRMREASLSGEIEQLLRWFPVESGETYFLPAGTVHALGAGIALCEIQQNSDITYRLFDYGRPRELHLEQALAVAEGGVYAGPSRPRALADGWVRLAGCEWFTTDRLTLAGVTEFSAGHEPDDDGLLVCLEGRARLGPGAEIRAGETWLIPAGAAGFSLMAQPMARLLRIRWRRSRLR